MQDVYGTNRSNQSSPRPARGGFYFFIIVLIIAAGVLGYFYYEHSQNNVATLPDAATYQAVFLDNGQDYFGKLVFVGNNAVLTNVFYLKAPGNQANQINPEQQIQLVKLGSELHGPEDKMFINTDKILYWENMKDGSKVIQAIKQYNATAQ